MNGNGNVRGTRAPHCHRPRRIVITGAGGFVGRHVVAALAAAGHAVLAVSRQIGLWPAEVGRVTTPDRPWEAAATAHWTALLDSVRADAVVHLAAMAHVAVNNRDARRELRQINIGLTDRLAEAALAAGVNDFVFISSVKALGECSEPGRPLNDTAPPGVLDAYGRAKRIAERRLQRRFPERQASGPEGQARLTILRPPLVYGAGVGANMAALGRWVGRGWPLPLASIENRRSLIYVENLADAIRAVLETPHARSGCWLLSDGAAVSTPDLVRELARAQSSVARLWPCPPRLLGQLARLTGRHATWQRLAGSLEVDDRSFRDAFGWTPPCTLAEGLARQYRDGA